MTPTHYLGQRNCARLVISPSGDHLDNESPAVVTTASPCRIRTPSWWPAVRWKGVCAGV